MRHSSIISNESGGVYLLTMMTAVALAGSFLYVKNHFERKLEKVAFETTEENAKNVKRELAEALSDPRICLATLGPDFRIRPGQIQEEFIEPEERPPGQIENALIFDQISLVSTTGEMILNNQQTNEGNIPKFLSSPDLKLRDTQLVFPDSIDPGLATQNARASLYITYSSYKNGEFQKNFPTHKQDLYLRLKKQGSSHSVIGCAPARSPEMEPVNFVTFKKELRGDERVQIIKNGRQSFKMCTMSGFKFKPDLNNSNTIRFRGQIAGRAPWECLLYPIDSAGNRLNPSSITHPVRWMMSLNADIDYNFLGIQWIEFKSDVMCEAICF